MSIAATSVPSLPKRRKGYFPFLHLVAPSALLAALLVKWSSVVAPTWGIQAAAWTITLLYLYFALARASFVQTHCILHGKGIEAATVARGELAFAVALRRRRQGLGVFAGTCLVIAAALDVAIRVSGADIRDAVAGVVIAAAGAGWFHGCPGFLVAASLWVTEPEVRLRRGFELTRRFPRLVWPLWFGVVVLIAIVSWVPLVTLYRPLGAFVLSVVPSALVAYLYSAAFLAVLIAFQFRMQAAFAAWVAARLARREQEAALSGRSGGEGGGRRARPAEMVLTAILGVVMCALAVLFHRELPPSAKEVLTARVISSSPACAVTRGKGPRSIRRREATCADAAAPGRTGTVEQGEVLRLRFVGRTGVEHRVEQFFRAEIAGPAIAAGEIRVLFDPETPASVLHHPGKNHRPWWSFIPLVLGLLGGGFLVQSGFRAWTGRLQG